MDEIFDYTDNEGDAVRATRHCDGSVVIRIREHKDRWRYMCVPASEVASLVAYLEGE